MVPVMEGLAVTSHEDPCLPRTGGTERLSAGACVCTQSAARLGAGVPEEGRAVPVMGAPSETRASSGLPDGTVSTGAFSRF